jgi:hypothetical protein
LQLRISIQVPHNRGVIKLIEATTREGIKTPSFCPQIAGVGDFNGDGKADILWRDASGEAYIWLVNGLSIINQGSPEVVGNDWSIE